MSNQPIDIYDETSGSKFMRKVREAPFLMAGITGCVVACGVGAYKFKNKGAMSTSVYLMQLRVMAQGIVVGSLTAGVALTMLNKYVLHKKSE